MYRLNQLCLNVYFLSVLFRDVVPFLKSEGVHLLLGPFPDKKLGAKALFISIWQKKKGGGANTSLRTKNQMGKCPLQNEIVPYDEFFDT